MCSLRGWWLLEVADEAAPAFFYSADQTYFEDGSFRRRREQPGGASPGPLPSGRVASSPATGSVTGGSGELEATPRRSRTVTESICDEEKGRNLHAVRVLLSRRYATVDERWRKLAGPGYVPLPSDEELRQAFETQLLYEPEDDAWRCCACCSTASGGERGSSLLSSPSVSSCQAHTASGSPPESPFHVEGERPTADSCVLHSEDAENEDGIFENNPSFYYDLYQERYFEEPTWPCGPTAMLVLPSRASDSSPPLPGGRGSPSLPGRSCSSWENAPSPSPHSHRLSDPGRCERGLCCGSCRKRPERSQRKSPFSLSDEAGARGVCSLPYRTAPQRDALSGYPSPSACPPSPPRTGHCLPVNSPLFSILWPVVFVRKEIPASPTETDSLALSGASKPSAAELTGTLAVRRQTSAFTGGTPVPAALLRPTSARNRLELAAAGPNGQQAEDLEDALSAGFPVAGSRQGQSGRVIVALAALAIDDALEVDSLHPATARSFGLPQVTAAFHVLDHVIDLYLSFSLAFPSPPLATGSASSPVSGASKRRDASPPRASAAPPYGSPPSLPHTAPDVSAHWPRQRPFGPSRGDSSAEGGCGAHGRQPALPFLTALQLALPFGRPKLTSPTLLQHAYESVSSLPVSYSFLPPRAPRETTRRKAGARGLSRDSFDDASDCSRGVAEEARASSGRRRRRSEGRRRKGDMFEDDPQLSLVPPRPPGPTGPAQSLAQLRETKVRKYLQSLSPDFSTLDSAELPAASADLRALQLRHWRRQLEAQRESLSRCSFSGPSSDFFESTLGSSVCLDLEDQGAAFSDVSFSDLCPPVAAPHSRTHHRRFFEHALWRRRATSPWAGSDPVGAQLANASALACASAFTPAAAGSVWAVPAWLPQLSPSGWVHGVPRDSAEGGDKRGFSRREAGSASPPPNRASRRWWWVLGAKTSGKNRAQSLEGSGSGARRGGPPHPALSIEPRRHKGRPSWWKSSREASLGAVGEEAPNARGGSWEEERHRTEREWLCDSGALTDVEACFDVGRRRGRSKEERHAARHREEHEGSLVMLNGELAGERVPTPARRNKPSSSSLSPRKKRPSGFSIFSAFGRATGLVSTPDADTQQRAAQWNWLTRHSWIRFSIVENVHCAMHEPKQGVQGRAAREADESSIVGDVYVTVCLPKMMEVSAPLAFARTESLPDVYVHPTARLSNSAVDLLSCASARPPARRGVGAEPGEQEGDRDKTTVSFSSAKGQEARSVLERHALPPLVVSCVPPLGVHSYLLCKYRFGSLPFYPMKALYQVKEIRPGVLRLLLQLQIHPGVVGRLHACSLWIPFGHKGRIESHDLKASQGTFRIVSGQQAVLWTLPKHLKSTPVVSGSHAAAKDSTGASPSAAAPGGKEEAKAPPSGRPQVSLLGELILASHSSSTDREAGNAYAGSKASSAWSERFPLSTRRRRRAGRLPSDSQQASGGSLRPAGCGDTLGASFDPHILGRSGADSGGLLGAQGGGAAGASAGPFRACSAPTPQESASRWRRDNLIAAAGAEERLPLAVRRFLADEVEREEAETCRFASDQEPPVGTGPGDSGPGAESLDRAQGLSGPRGGACGTSGSGEERRANSNFAPGDKRVENACTNAAHAEKKPLRAGQALGGGARDPGVGGDEGTSLPLPDRVEGSGASAKLRVRSEGGRSRGTRPDEEWRHAGRSFGPSTLFAGDSGSPYRPGVTPQGPLGSSGAGNDGASSRGATAVGHGRPGGGVSGAGFREREPHASLGSSVKGRSFGSPQNSGVGRGGVYATSRTERSGGGLLTDREELILQEGVNNFLALIHFEVKSMTLSGATIDKEAVTLYPYQHLELAPPVHWSPEVDGSSAGASGSGPGGAGSLGDREKLKGAPAWIRSSGGSGDDAGCSISVFKRTIAGRYVVWNALGDNKASRVNLSFDEVETEKEADACSSEFSTHTSGPRGSSNHPGGFRFAASAMPAFPSTVASRQALASEHEGSASLRGETEEGTTVSHTPAFPDADVRVDKSLSGQYSQPVRISGAAAAEREPGVHTGCPSSTAGSDGCPSPYSQIDGDKVESKADVR
ncbi:adaptor complexes medium subunit family protein [Toxoplasma gondii RUB]|uniref:Adaptor complexes medium subunit family protein n=1 Tax=Toxoplasma gondii RUB TaxID=935652 RepID=A0A086LND5_TOXGO|nr:adaptor complexes medium subunit family protein [Toxoplasma gondii RUB]